MYCIDTHIHLQDFNSDFAPKVLSDENCLKLIVVSSCEKDFASVSKLIDEAKYKVVGAFGVHPWYIKDDLDFEKLEECLLQYPKALVGEIGVDGIRNPTDLRQHRVFSEQLFIAKKYNRPVILHGAKAFEALKEHKNELDGLKFVYHGFTKNREIIKFVNSLGGYFGIGKMFLRQNEAFEMINEMPFNKILFETDAPFQIKDENYLNDRESYLENLIKLYHNFDGDFSEQLISNALEFMQC
jgi:TatD DNase family protein